MLPAPHRTFTGQSVNLRPVKTPFICSKRTKPMHLAIQCHILNPKCAGNPLWDCRYDGGPPDELHLIRVVVSNRLHQMQPKSPTHVRLFKKADACGEIIHPNAAFCVSGLFADTLLKDVQRGKNPGWHAGLARTRSERGQRVSGKASRTFIGELLACHSRF